MKHTPLALALVLSLSTTYSMAGSADAGKAASGTCAGCHGGDGISLNPEWPNLAGQREAYLVSSLLAYRNGKRKNDLMSPMAKSLSDEQIADLAAYFSSL